MDVSNSRRENLGAEQERFRQAHGLRLFKPAPEGFDPIAATDRELLVHGYPARPDAKRHPELLDRWTQLMSRPMMFVEPQFATMQGAWSDLRYELPVGTGWAGSTVFPAYPDTVASIHGQWTVPHVVAPGPGDCICAEWVGIDGAPGAPHAPDSSDILQAGTTQWIVGGVPDSFAWCEWWTEKPITITNLAVSPGDTMHCMICVLTPTQGGIHLWNITTGAATSFIKTPMDPNSGIRLVGNTAEWILEAPVRDELTSEMNLAQFGDVYFDNCLAFTQNGELLVAGGGRLVTLDGTPDGGLTVRTIAVPSIENDLLFKVEYTGH